MSVLSATAARQNFDRIVWSDDPAPLSCPRCDCGMNRVQLEDHAAAACPKCRGVILSNPSFAEIVRARRANYRGAELTPRPVDLEALTEPVHCPGCRRLMEVHPYYGPGCQIIDSCCRCGIVWIDTGELTAIEQAPGVR